MKSEIDLREAFTGIKKEINFDTLIRCDDCGGSGSERGCGMKDCGICGGSGRTRASQGFLLLKGLVHHVGGQGQTITDLFFMQR